jgi:hypothetical protein
VVVAEPIGFLYHRDHIGKAGLSQVAGVEQPIQA